MREIFGLMILGLLGVIFYLITDMIWSWNVGRRLRRLEEEIEPKKKVKKDKSSIRGLKIFCIFYVFLSTVCFIGFLFNVPSIAEGLAVACLYFMGISISGAVLLVGTRLADKIEAIE